MHSGDNVHIYNSVVEFLDGYPESYRDDFEEQSEGIVL